MTKTKRKKDNGRGFYIYKRSIDCRNEEEFNEISDMFDNILSRMDTIEDEEEL